VRLVCLDRLAAPAALQGDACFANLARQTLALAQGRPVHLMGFSMGAFVALQTCRFLPGQVASLHLVSAAAPLEAGDFLPHMAGRQVFGLAQRTPRLLAVLTRLQAGLSRLWPRALYAMLFASAAGADQPLVRQSAFARTMQAALFHALASRRPGYLRELQAYVQPWQHTLSQVAVPARLWHGTQDNWAPPDMAIALHKALPVGSQLHWLEGASHYSALLAAFAQIACRLGQAPEASLA
jgi:pimeloyl-ACP methyl ester carboxylesterase